MLTQDDANLYRGTIIDVATLIESKIDVFFINYFHDGNDRVKAGQFMALFLNRLTFGNKIERFNSLVKDSASLWDEKRAQQMATQLNEFKTLRNNLAHRNGFINEDKKFQLYSFDKDDVTLDQETMSKSVTKWIVFSEEVKKFISDFLNWQKSRKGQ